MRGAVSAAMLAQLDDAGFKNAFDVVYGTSSGSINGAFFLAHDTWYPLSIYHEDLPTKQFVDFARPLRGGSILNLDYVFDQVLELVKPLNYQAVIDSPVPLVVSATDVDALETVTFRDFSSVPQLKSVMRAGTWLPIAVHGTAELEGRRYLDGGLLTALPFRLAQRDDCTHILSLSTLKMRNAPKKAAPIHQYVSLHLEQIRRGLGRGYLAALQQRYRDQQWLAQQRLSAAGDGPYVLDLALLPWMPRLKLNELDPHNVLASIQDAYAVSHCATEGLDVSRLRDRSLRAMPRLTMVDTACLV
jgi:predicted patatin/cPLA2 family phospholipase